MVTHPLCDIYGCLKSESVMDGRIGCQQTDITKNPAIGSLQGADLLLEIPAELGNLEVGTELGAQLLRLPIF